MKKIFIIDNCEFKVAFKCPLLWKDLQSTDNSDARYCNECEKEVYRCNDEKEVKKHIGLKHCIATEGNFIDNQPIQELTAAAGVALAISSIKDFDDNFDMHDWKNRSQARQLINDVKGIINANRATKQNLDPIVVQLYGLLEKNEPEPLIGIIEDY